MTATDYSGLKRHEHPLDIVERLASIHDRTFDRPGDDEITLTVQGNWGLYHVAFNWLESMEAFTLLALLISKCSIVGAPRSTSSCLASTNNYGLVILIFGQTIIPSCFDTR